MNAIQIHVLKWQQLNSGFFFVQLIKLQRRWELGGFSTWLPDTITLGMGWSRTSQKGAFGEASLLTGYLGTEGQGQVPSVPFRDTTPEPTSRVSTTPLRDPESHPFNRWASGDIPYPIWAETLWNSGHSCIMVLFNMCECDAFICTSVCRYVPRVCGDQRRLSP